MEKLLAVFGVVNLGMELNAVQPALFVCERADFTIIAVCNNFKTGRANKAGVVMAHPCY